MNDWQHRHWDSTSSTKKTILQPWWELYPEFSHFSFLVSSYPGSHGIFAEIYARPKIMRRSPRVGNVLRLREYCARFSQHLFLSHSISLGMIRNSKEDIVKFASVSIRASSLPHCISKNFRNIRSLHFTVLVSRIYTYPQSTVILKIYFENIPLKSCNITKNIYKAVRKVS